jgi:hypothetical protein
MSKLDFTHAYNTIVAALGRGAKTWFPAPALKVEGAKTVTLSIEYTYYYYIVRNLKFLMLATEKVFQRTKICLLWMS